MKIKLIPIGLTLVCFLFVVACEDEVSNLTIDSRTAVVEGFLFAGQALDSLKITQAFSYAREDTNLISLDGLNVIINDGRTEYLLNSIGNGFYENKDFFPQSGLSYFLSFEHNGRSINAETYIPEKRTASISQTSVKIEKIDFSNGFPVGGFTQLDPIEITWENPEGDYYYVVIENLEDDPEFVNDRLAEFDANGDVRRFLQITEPEITDFHLINPRRELIQYGTYQIIVFSVNPEYAALYQSSGTSSVTLTQPASNIKNGLGIFTGVNSDTLYLEVTKL